MPYTTNTPLSPVVLRVMAMDGLRDTSLVCSTRWSRGGHVPHTTNTPFEPGGAPRDGHGWLACHTPPTHLLSPVVLRAMAMDGSRDTSLVCSTRWSRGGHVTPTTTL